MAADSPSTVFTDSCAPDRGVPDGGLSLWLRLPDGVSDLEVAQRCAVRRVLVTAGTPYYAGAPPAPHLRLTYCAEDEPTLTRGISLLGSVLRDMTG